MRWLVYVAAVGVASVILWEFSKSRDFQLFGEAIARIETGAPFVALTFDDGPSKRHTAEVLAILADKDVQGTFFLTGHEMAESPDLTKQIAAAGHELGNHSYSHDRLILTSASAVRSKIDRTDALIRQAGTTGEIPFRPPYGQKLVVLPWVLSKGGRPAVMWELTEPKDATSSEQMAAQIVSAAQPGSIILMHVMYDSRAMSRQALPLVIDGLRARGLEPVTLRRLMQGETAR